MNKSILFAFVITVLTLQVFANSRFGLDFDGSKAFLYGGDCYINPGISSGSNMPADIRYYTLPYGWSQFNDKIVIPNLISQRGNWDIGLKVTSGSNQFNDQFRVTVNGLSIRLSSQSGLGSRNLVIGSNFRSQGVSDDEWANFIGIISGGRPISIRESSSGSGYFRRSPRVRFTDDDRWIQNLIRSSGYNEQDDDDDFVTSIMISQTPALTQVSQVSSVQRRKALDRQVTANKVLNELNTLITQLTSNVDSTSASVTKLQGQLQKVRTTSTQCNDKILELNSAKVSAQTAINEINNQLSQSQGKLKNLNTAFGALVDKKNSLVQQRTKIEQKKAPNSKQLSGLEQRFTTCNTQATTIRNQYSGVVESIQKNSDQIVTLRNSAADAPRQITLVNQQLTIVDRNIADLEAQLREARGKKAKLQSDKARYASIVDSSNTQIKKLQSDNNGLRGQLDGLKSRVDTQVVQCTTFKTQSDKIRSEIASNQKDYDQIVKQIEVQQGLISSRQTEINKLNAEISSLPSRRNPLQNNLNSAKTALQRQYSICSSSTSTVARVQSDIQAANLKLETEKRFLSDAKGKLSSAQAQKKAADDAVTKIMSTVSTTSLRTGSTPTVTAVTFGRFGTPVTVNGPEYLVRNYGNGVRRYWQPYVSDLDSSFILYPLSETTWGALTGLNSAGVFLPKNGAFLLPSIDGLGSAIGVIDNSGSSSGSVSTGSSRFGDDDEESEFGGKGSDVSVGAGRGFRGGLKYLGSFQCSANSGLLSGYGKVISVQPGYIIVQTPSNGSMNLRIGRCSRLESNRPSFVTSVYDNIFYRGVKIGKDFHVYDLTCLS